MPSLTFDHHSVAGSPEAIAALAAKLARLAELEQAPEWAGPMLEDAVGALSARMSELDGLSSKMSELEAKTSKLDVIVSHFATHIPPPQQAQSYLAATSIPLPQQPRPANAKVKSRAKAAHARKPISLSH